MLSLVFSAFSLKNVTPSGSNSVRIGAKARAILEGRYHATTEDVRAIALPVLRHRVLTTFNAEAAGVTSDDIVNMLIDHIQSPDDLNI